MLFLTTMQQQLLVTQKVATAIMKLLQNFGLHGVLNNVTPKQIRLQHHRKNKRKIFLSQLEELAAMCNAKAAIAVSFKRFTNSPCRTSASPAFKKFGR